MLIHTILQELAKNYRIEEGDTGTPATQGIKRKKDEEEREEERQSNNKKEEEREEESESEVEEISEAAMKEYQNKEKTFPGYRWEPRVTEEDEVRVMKHTEEPYIEAINMDNRSQKWGYGHMYELYEPISWFWRTAEWDLKEQALGTNKKKCKSK